MAKILIVEDEPAMRTGLIDNLEIEGYDVDSAKDGSEGFSKITSVKYDLIILDIMMPGMSGFDICKKTRAKGNNTPIILLTAKGEEIDKVLGLEIGADDYITKPFGLREFLARVKALLRRSETHIQNSEEYKIGNLEINFATYSASSEGKEVNLSYREYEVLKYLIDHKNETVSRDNLLKDVWGHDNKITTRTIDNFILKLRQKIEADANHPKIILTIYGVGYKLIF